jgi:NMT1/THI5 like
MQGRDIVARIVTSHGLVLVVVFASMGPANAQSPIAVTVGATSVTSDAPIYIADKKGYFREEGLAVKVENFRSALPFAAISTRLRPSGAIHSRRIYSGRYWTRLRQSIATKESGSIELIVQARAQA